MLARRALPDCVSAARRRSVGLFAATALLLGACTVECKPCLGAPAVQIVGVLPDQGRVLWVCVDVNWPPSRLSTPTASDTYPATRAIHRTPTHNAAGRGRNTVSQAAVHVRGGSC